MQTCFRMRLCDLVIRISKHSKQFLAFIQSFRLLPVILLSLGLAAATDLILVLRHLNEKCFKIFHADALHTPNSIWIVQHGLD